MRDVRGGGRGPGPRRRVVVAGRRGANRRPPDADPPPEPGTAEGGALVPPAPGEPTATIEQPTATAEQPTAASPAAEADPAEPSRRGLAALRGAPVTRPEPPTGPVQPPVTTDRPGTGPVHPPVTTDRPGTGPVQPPVPVAEPTLVAGGPVAGSPPPAPLTPAGGRAGAGPSRSALVRVAPWAAAVLVVALAAALGSLWWKVSQRQSAEAARRQAFVAAQTAANAIFAYDYRSIDAEVARAERLMTPRFLRASQYDKIAHNEVIPLAQKYQGVVTISVVGVGVTQASADRVVTLVFFDSVNTSTSRRVPGVQQQRVRLVLRKRGGHWLVDDITAL